MRFDDDTIRRRAAGSVRALAAACVALVLAACTLIPESTPVDMYVIEVAPSELRLDCPVAFSVREVRLAGHLDRPEIVVGKVGPRIETSPDALWASAPARELPGAIARGLSERLAGSRIVPHPWRFGEAPELALSVEVDRLEPESGALVARLRWSAAEPRGEAPASARDEFSARIPMRSADAGATAEAIAVTLGRFADHLAERIVAHPEVGALCRR